MLLHIICPFYDKLYLEAYKNKFGSVKYITDFWGGIQGGAWNKIF